MNKNAALQNVMIDFFSVLFVLFFTLFILAIVYLSEEQSKKKIIDSDGLIRVTIEWNKESDSDIDLHIITPLDHSKECYFRNTSFGGVVLDLDDRGHATDTSQDIFGNTITIRQNKEVAKFREVFDGEYIIFVHGWRVPSSGEKVTYKIVDLTKNQIIDAGELEISHGGEIGTLARLICKDKNVVEVNHMEYSR